MSQSSWRRAVSLVLVLCCSLAIASVLPGCANEPLLTRFTVQPSLITPNADGVDDIAHVSYSLRRNADVSLYLVDSRGERHFFRKDVRRSLGDYTVDFGGVIEGRMLPDGNYRMVIEARPTDGGPVATMERPLTLRDADTNYPQIIGLQVFPDSFSPNRDGLGDRVRISYDLSKAVSRTDIYLLGPDGTHYPIPEDKVREPGAIGHHEHDYDGGIDLGAEPPPAGTYKVVVIVEDAVGNRTEAETTLKIEDGGVPRATIVKSGEGTGVVWSATVVPLGQVLSFTLTVQNIGPVPIRTQGPEPGTIYDNNQNYNTLGFSESPGVFRIGINYEGNSAGDPYPYRWQLGKTSELTKRTFQGRDYYYLMPGQTVTVTGGIRMVQAPPLRNPRFWAGLIHEQVEYVPGEDYVNPTQITIGY